MLKIENPKVKIFSDFSSSFSDIKKVERLYNDWVEQLSDNTRVIDVQFHSMGSSNSDSVIKVLYLKHNEKAEDNKSSS